MTTEKDSGASPSRQLRVARLAEIFAEDGTPLHGNTLKTAWVNCDQLLLKSTSSRSAVAAFPQRLRSCASYV